jgi:acetyl esterase/lipase
MIFKLEEEVSKTLKNNWKMKQISVVLLSCLALIAFVAPAGLAKDSPSVQDPIICVYATISGKDLKAYLFFPNQRDAGKPRPAIVLFHGGGWNEGEPEWVFRQARHFAERGMVAIAAQYRLSDQQMVTPLDAIADARSVIHWLRCKAAELNIDAKRIAAGGVSAGGHLAASTAIFVAPEFEDKVSASPNALVLWFPAVSLGSDGWAQKLLGNRANARDISPDEHIRKGLPPMIIFQGSEDTVTPLVGAQRFCERMKQAGNQCDLQVYQGLGHLFSRERIEQAAPDVDQKARADALMKADRFLAANGFLKK